MTVRRILISNDDGVHAEGIQTLAKALAALGDVWVVAPDRERSATSHSISLHKPLRLRQVGERCFCVDGTPTDSVYLALHHALPGPPDIVVSGINHGANLGNDVIYSGTVSAAMEAALFGYPAVATSLCLGDANGAAAPCHFEAAAQVTAEVVEAALAQPMPPGVLLNVNIPNRPRQDILGTKLTRLGYTAWNEHVDVRRDPRGRPYYWIGGTRATPSTTSADSDVAAVEAGYVSVTPIHYDVTDYRSFAYVRGLSMPHLTAAADALGDKPLAASGMHPQRRT